MPTSVFRIHILRQNDQIHDHQDDGRDDGHDQQWDADHVCKLHPGVAGSASLLDIPLTAVAHPPASIVRLPHRVAIMLRLFRAGFDHRFAFSAAEWRIDLQDELKPLQRGLSHTFFFANEKIDQTNHVLSASAFSSNRSLTAATKKRNQIIS